MNLVQILTLVGIPSVSGAFILYVVGRLHESKKRIAALEAGVQALLRSQMISSFDKWNDRKYAPLYAKDNFENMWKQYHALGANGVMDDMHNKFMALPSHPAAQ